MKNRHSMIESTGAWMWRAALQIAAIGLFCLPLWAAELTIIDLHNRTAAEVIPILRPLVDSNVAMSAADYKLLVRGSSADIARIREALAVLDQAPKQLLVSVRYADAPESSQSQVGARLSGNTSTRQVIVGGGGSVQTSRDTQTSSVRVLEGNAAHISTGQSVPVVSTVLLSNSRVGVETNYRELENGFDVKPRINGERVVLDIYARQEKMNNSTSGTIDVQRASTTVTGSLGQWIELGGITSSETQQSSVVGFGASRRTSTQSDQRSIAIKVELAP